MIDIISYIRSYLVREEGIVKMSIHAISKYSFLFFPTRAESFGLVAIEAMMAKIPLLLSDIPVLRSIVNNGEYAQLFIDGDIDDCAKSMDILTENINQNHISGIMEKARQHVINNYSQENMNINYIKLYEGIL